MKKQFHLLYSILFFAGIIIFSSCQKTSTTVISNPSTPLAAFINSDTSVSVFYAAVQKAGDLSLYAGTDSVTVLIPTNAAFAAEGITSSSIASMSTASLDSLLRYHFIPSSAILVYGEYNSYTSKLGPPVYGYGNTDAISNYFNGSLAILQTIGGSNATVYKLSAPLQIPFNSATQLIAADASLTYFAEAVKYSGISIAPVSGWNTILAPTNSAFVAAGYTTLASIDSADVTSLTNILQYHILPGQYFTNIFLGSATVVASNGVAVNLTFNNGLAQFTGTGNINAAGITNANRIAGTNIIVHNINGVLLQ